MKDHKKKRKVKIRSAEKQCVCCERLNGIEVDKYRYVEL